LVVQKQKIVKQKYSAHNYEQLGICLIMWLAFMSNNYEIDTINQKQPKVQLKKRNNNKTNDGH